MPRVTLAHLGVRVLLAQQEQPASVAVVESLDLEAHPAPLARGEPLEAVEPLVEMGHLAQRDLLERGVPQAQLELRVILETLAGLARPDFLVLGVPLEVPDTLAAMAKPVPLALLEMMVALDLLALLVLVVLLEQWVSPVPRAHPVSLASLERRALLDPLAPLVCLARMEMLALLVPLGLLVLVEKGEKQVPLVPLVFRDCLVLLVRLESLARVASRVSLVRMGCLVVLVQEANVELPERGEKPAQGAHPDPVEATVLLARMELGVLLVPLVPRALLVLPACKGCRESAELLVCLAPRASGARLVLLVSLVVPARMAPGD